MGAPSSPTQPGPSLLCWRRCACAQNVGGRGSTNGGWGREKSPVRSKSLLIFSHPSTRLHYLARHGRGATDITYFSQRSAGSGDAGVKHLYLDGATSAIGSGGGGGGGSGEVCTWRQAFVVAPFHSNLDADLLSI